MPLAVLVMALEHRLDSLIARIVRDAGSQSAFGRSVGYSQSTVREWLISGRVGYKAVLKVEEVTGVSKHDLRPDLYPREAAPAPADAVNSEIAR